MMYSCPQKCVHAVEHCAETWQQITMLESNNHGQYEDIVQAHASSHGTTLRAECVACCSMNLSLACLLACGGRIEFAGAQCIRTARVPHDVFCLFCCDGCAGKLNWCRRPKEGATREILTSQMTCSHRHHLKSRHAAGRTP